MGAKVVVVVDGAVLVDGIVEVVSCATVVVVAIGTIDVDVDVEEVGPLSAVQLDITSDAPKAAMTYDRRLRVILCHSPRRRWVQDESLAAGPRWRDGESSRSKCRTNSVVRFRFL